MIYAISVDWFQYYCKNETNFSPVFGSFLKGTRPDSHGNFHTYQIAQAVEFHSMYRESFRVLMDGLSMLHVYLVPKMSSLDPKSVSVKVDNRLLYKRDWSWFLHDIIETLGLRICNITRVDLCMDFKRFDYEDLTPAEFLHRYIQDQSVATEETYIREGSNEFCVYGSKNLKAENGAEVVDDSTPITVESNLEYVRFGSRNSGVCTYLYNKEKELRDKKSKPWIKERWLESGLWSQQEYDADSVKTTVGPGDKQSNEPHDDIYRLEFSISTKGMCLKKADRKRGMKKPAAPTFRKLCRDDLETQRQLELVFWGYCAKYFSFRKVGKQKYRKDMKQVPLFAINIEPSLLPCYYNTKLNHGRSERNAAAVLQRIQWQVQDLSTEQRNTLFKAQQIMESLSVQIRDLNEHDSKTLLFFGYTPPQQKILADRTVKKAIDEVEVTQQIIRETIKDFDDCLLSNEGSFAEWCVQCDTDAFIKNTQIINS